MTTVGRTDYVRLTINDQEIDWHNFNDVAEAQKFLKKPLTDPRLIAMLLSAPGITLEWELKNSCHRYGFVLITKRFVEAA